MSTPFCAASRGVVKGGYWSHRVSECQIHQRRQTGTAQVFGLRGGEYKASPDCGTTARSRRYIALAPLESRQSPGGFR